jgi:hypothetical protein
MDNQDQVAPKTVSRPSAATIIIEPISWTARSLYGDNYYWKYDGNDKIEIHCEIIDGFDLICQERWAEINIRTGIYTYIEAETAPHAATMNN